MTTVKFDDFLAEQLKDEKFQKKIFTRKKEDG